MNQQLKFEIFQGEGFSTEEEESMHEELSDHLLKLGFNIGATNVAELDQEAFAASRHAGFGGSDAAVLLGVAYESKKVTMKTPEELYQEKIDEHWDESISQLGAVKKGSELEDLFIQKISKALEMTIIKPRHSYINKQGLAINFDGVAIEKNKTGQYYFVPIEIKLATTYGRSKYFFEKGIDINEDNAKEKILQILPLDPKAYHNGNIQNNIKEIAAQIGFPPYYYPQVQQEMYFLNAPHGYLAVMDELNWNMHVFKIKYDKDTIERLCSEAYNWYLKLAAKKDLEIEHIEYDSDDI